MYNPLESHSTAEPDYSPWSLLPAPEPRSYNPPPSYFYDNVAKHLIKDTVRLMNNGLHINLERVSELESTLDSQLLTVEQELASNTLIKEYLKQTRSSELEAYTLDRQSKCRSPEYYLKPFDHKNMHHRSYFMHIFSQSQNFSGPAEEIHPGISKWPVLKVKKLVPQFPILTRLLEGKLTDSHPIVKQALELLAQHKCDIYNSKFLAQIKNPDIPYPTFNPASPKDVPGVFALAGVESETFSKKTGNPSFNRDELERIQREYSDPTILHLVNNLIDYSNAAIIRNNFISAFYKYTINSRLYGQYKLLGAKSGRYTSSQPNMLNAPSTGSIFAKPIKRCFEAPPGFVIGAIDYSALEDRVMACLSRDTNKCGLFLEDLDGHSLSATYYYPDRVAALIGPYTDNKDASRKLKALVDSGDKEAKSVRQDSKPISFGLAYGSFPKKVAATVKIPLSEAQDIFDAYHNELYPGITEYRENYVLPTTQEHGRIHLGLGFYIHSDDPERDIRTLNNATCQMWSLLTALTINKIHLEIDKAGYQDDILVTSSIYDSIYFEIREDPTLIKWLNDTLVPIMTVDFIENQIVHNLADLEIGRDWADLHLIQNNASLDNIQEILNGFNNTD